MDNEITKRIFKMSAEEIVPQITALSESIKKQNLNGDVRITIKADGTFELENSAVPGMIFCG